MKKFIIIVISLIIAVLAIVSVVIVYPYMQFAQYAIFNMEEAPIMKYSREGDVNKVKSLINSGADINTKDHTLDTPLHTALFYGNYSVARVLIDAGAYVKAKNIDGVTTLDALCDEVSRNKNSSTYQDQYELAKILIKKGVEVNSLGGRGKNNPLIRAVGTGNIKLIKLLIEKGADVNAVDRSGKSPLAYIPHKFYQEGGNFSPETQLQIAKLLVENGAKINFKNKNSINLIYTLIENGNDPSVLKYLIDKGIKVDMDMALFLAVSHNKDEAAKIFIENGANVNYKYGVSTSVLEQAIAFNNDKLINLLISKGAKTNIENNICNVEIIKMASSKEPKISKILIELLEKDKSYNCEDNDKNRLLMHAVKGENIHLINYLLKKGLDVKHKNKDGQTALMLTKDPYIAQLLIKYGADVNAKDIEGKTPLMYSLEESQDMHLRRYQNGSSSLAELLLVNGANIEQKDIKGRTALFHAAMLNSFKQLEMLLENYANIKVKDNEGNTILHALNISIKSDYPIQYYGHSNNCLLYGFLIRKGADITAKNNKGIDINTKAKEGNCDIQEAIINYEDSLKRMGTDTTKENEELKRKISFISTFVSDIESYSFKYDDKRHIKLLGSLYDTILKANKDKFIKIKNYNYKVIFEKLQQLSNSDIFKDKNIDFYNYLNNNSLDKARNIVQQKIKSTKNKEQLARYYSILADVEYLDFEHDKAYKSMEQAVKLNPKNIDYAKEIYRLCLRIEKFDDLNMYSNQIIKLINSEVDYNFNHFDMYYNKIYQDPKYSNYNEIVKSYQSTITEEKEKILKNKTFLYPTENPSGKYLIQDLSCEEAIEKANSFWTNNENNIRSDHYKISMLYEDLAEVYREVKHYQTAIMMLKKGLWHSKIYSADYIERFYSKMAKTAQEGKDLKSVVKYYKLAIDASTNNNGLNDSRTQDYYYDLIDYLCRNKQYNEALEYCKQALKLFKDIDDSHCIDNIRTYTVFILIMKIKYAIRANDYSKALKILNEASVYCNKDSKKRLRSDLNSLYAEIAYRQKNYDNVIKYATIALEDIDKLEEDKKSNRYNRFKIYKDLFYLFEAYKIKKDTKNTLLYFDKVEAARDKVDKDLDLNTHLSTCFKIE